MKFFNFTDEEKQNLIYALAGGTTDKIINFKNEVLRRLQNEIDYNQFLEKKRCAVAKKIKKNPDSEFAKVMKERDAKLKEICKRGLSYYDDCFKYVDSKSVSDEDVAYKTKGLPNNMGELLLFLGDYVVAKNCNAFEEDEVDYFARTGVENVYYFPERKWFFTYNKKTYCYSEMYGQGTARMLRLWNKKIIPNDEFIEPSKLVNYFINFEADTMDYQSMYSRAINQPQQMILPEEEFALFTHICHGEKISIKDGVYEDLRKSLKSYFENPQGEDENGKPVNFYVLVDDKFQFKIHDVYYELEFKDSDMTIKQFTPLPGITPYEFYVTYWTKLPESDMF